MSKKKQKVVPFKWKPLSPKQQFMFLWWRHDDWSDYDAIIADGSVRSGKTASMSLSFVDWAMETHDDSLLGMAGKTIQSLRRNVITPLQRMMIGRKYIVEENRTENWMEVYNPRNGHVNKFYFFGGKDESSQDLIQGITLAGMFFDEVALMPESFVNQAVARCSEEGAKFWFNCNPDHPKHWFYVEWIQKLKQKNALRVHFTMDDNYSLSERTKRRYKNLYSGIFFLRFILGQWVAGDGVIFDMFDEGRHVVQPGNEPFAMHEADRLIIAADIGTQNATTFGLYGVKSISSNRMNYNDMSSEASTVVKNHYHLYDSYYHSGRDERKQKTHKEYVDDLFEFIESRGLKPEDIAYVIIDPSATAFIHEINERKQTDPYTGITTSRLRTLRGMNDVRDGIAAMMNHLELGYFTLTDTTNNRHDIDEFYSYQWDPKKLNRGIEQPIQDNDHCMDRNRYAVFTDTHMGGVPKIYSGRGAM